MKQQKKQLKREEMAKEENMKEKLKEINRYFSVLEKFADDKVRNDFLVENNGAIVNKDLIICIEISKDLRPHFIHLNT